jgi:hypothetical protein
MVRRANRLDNDRFLRYIKAARRPAVGSPPCSAGPRQKILQNEANILNKIKEICRKTKPKRTHFEAKRQPNPPRKHFDYQRRERRPGPSCAGTGDAFPACRIYA